MQVRGFTLVELILVMALMAVVMALSAPALSRSMRGRHLADEATRFLALTEYARDEAISQGVPMIVWIDAPAGRFGVEAKRGFTGEAGRAREFTVDRDVHFEMADAKAGSGLVEAVEFAPDGVPELGGVEGVRFVDRFAESLMVARQPDGIGFQIEKERK